MPSRDRSEGRALLDRAHEHNRTRLLAPVLTAYLTAYLAVDAMFVRTWSLSDGALIVPLAVMMLVALLADWRGWDRSRPFRRLTLISALVLGIVAALSTGRIG
ncbi:hypothetical protein GCM10028801_37310 [Nocardioides maradonensis]